MGHAFKFPPHDISALWPTSAILVSILVASPIRHWWAYLLAGYSTYAFDVARFGFLATDVLYNLADIIKVLIAAVGVRWLAGGLRAFDSLRGLVLYIAAAVVLAPATHVRRRPGEARAKLLVLLAGMVHVRGPCILAVGADPDLISAGPRRSPRHPFARFSLTGLPPAD